ncbi:MAG: diguanylate cyclase [Spirochaetota bacterium]|nr:diguanylate cyclase [Spirochaetota bacterium]
MRFDRKLFRTFYTYSFLLIFIISLVLFSFFYREYSIVKKENLYFLNILVQEKNEQVLKIIAGFGETIGQGKDVENLLGDNEISRFLADKYLTNYIDNILESYPFLEEVRIQKRETIVFSSSDNPLQITPGSTIIRVGDLLYLVDREQTLIEDSYMLFIVSVVNCLSEFNTLHNNANLHIAYIIDGTWAVVFDEKGNHSLHPVNEKSGMRVEIDQREYSYSWKKSPHLVQVVISMDSFYRNIRITILLLSLFIVLSGIILFFVIKNTSRSLTQPIRLLSEAASSVQEGELHQFHYKGVDVDEVESLITSFNYMVDEVQDFTQKLELEVQNRTKVIEEQRQSLELLNKELEMISVTDKMTGLLNRRSFDDITARDFELAARTNLFIGMGVVDIDLFKHVNDTYGHLCGDKIIVSVANNLKGVFRRSFDSIFRYGGDEFIIWTLYKKDKRDEFLSMVETLRSEVENHFYLCNEESEEIHVTISTGIFFGKVESRTHVKQIMEIADEMLYKVKEQGRNRVAINESEK